MKLRLTFSRLLRKSLALLQQKGSPMAMGLVNAYHQGKLKVLRLHNISEAELHSLCDHEAAEHSHRCKSDLMQTYLGLYLYNDAVYIQEAMSESDFLDTLAHEYVHYYTHKNKLTISSLEEELIARVLGGQATGKKITRHSIKQHIQNMKESDYFEAGEDLEGTDLDKVKQLLSHFPRM